MVGARVPRARRRCEMKSGWVTKKLGEVCEINYGTRVRRKDSRSDNYPVYGGGGETFRWETFNRENQCVVSRFAMSPECVRFVSGKFFLNDSGLTVDTASDGLLQDYLDWCLFGKQDIIYALGKGSAQKNLNIREFVNIPIPIPPLAEQKRIVEKIDAAFEKIDKLKANAERNLANAKELFQSALDEAMRPKKGWVEKRLGEVCDGRLSYGTSAPSCPYNGKVRYIRITDIDDEGRLLDELVSPKTFERKHILVEGDIVLARTGATVGKSYLYSPSDGDCVYAGYLIRARVNRSMVLPEFAFYFTKTGSYWQYIHTEQASAAQPNVNAEKYGNLLMPVPPLKEQREIAAMARVIHGKSLKLQHHYTRQIADCAEMRQAVLREAFEGRL